MTCSSVVQEWEWINENWICVLADVCVGVGVHVCDCVLDCIPSEVLQLLLPLSSPPHGRIHSPIQWNVSNPL